jgi:hypothetical protein
VSAYDSRDTITDSDNGELTTVRSTFVPVDLGVAAVERWGPRSLTAGISAVIAPYAQAVDHGGEDGGTGVGLSSPGLALWGGAGWRLGGSEIFAEARFTLFGAPGGTVSYEGSVGGLSASVGYRLLY